MIIRHYLKCFTAILSVASLPVAAQTFSYDGNRWYEIEVSIFTNDGPNQSNELIIPGSTELAYPDPIRQLVPASLVFQVDFEETEVQQDPLPGLDSIVNLTDISEIAESRDNVDASKFPGPPEKTDDTEFRVTDFNRDSFIALGSESAEFLEYNQNISLSPDHRLLFHAVWRQPLLNRAQSTAVLITGGNVYGEHHELEGSLRFSYNVNRVDLEAKLWLANFTDPIPGKGSGWSLPDSLVRTSEDASANRVLDYDVAQLAYMDQLRSMISNELHYLDNPGLGLLVEIRPYQLPEVSGFSFD